MSFLPSDFAATADIVQLKVDLWKAQSACERLPEQLMEAECYQDNFGSRPDLHYRRGGGGNSGEQQGR